MENNDLTVWDFVDAALYTGEIKYSQFLELIELDDENATKLLAEYVRKDGE